MGHQYDESIDIWTMGVILYEMVYNANPFRIANNQDLVNIIQEPIFFDESILVSPELRHCVSLCLAKQPQERPSIRELLQHPFVVRGLQSNQPRKP